MKKILRFYLPIFISIFALAIFVLIYTVRNHENALKCAFNKDCEVVSVSRNAVIKIDGIISEGSKIFEDEKNYYLVSDVYKKYSYSMHIINKSENDVTYPVGCFEVAFRKYLLLPDCALGIFLSNNAKGSGFDTTPAGGVCSGAAGAV